MPNQIQKSLQDYISKMKKYPATPRSISSSTSWILRGCKHPRTPSFSSCSSSSDRNKTTFDHAGSATLADVDRFLSENFKTLYENEEEEDRDIAEMMIETKINDDQQGKEEIFPNSAKMPDRRTNPRRRWSSDRVYTSRPAAASDDIDSAGTNTGTGDRHGQDEKETETEQLSPDDFITVLTYSGNPYDDYKNSMQEMIDARSQHNGKINWEFMEELLFCYLNLNDEKSHRFILRAFVDLVVIFRGNQGRIVPAPAKTSSFPAKTSRRPMRQN